MKRLSVFVLLLTIVTTRLSAYPISPRPLRLLVAESEHIITGYVIRTFEEPGKDEYHYGRTARIAITEQLKGHIQQDTIEVNYTPNMICPAPARYLDSTYVLAFLDEHEGRFTTHALSYGSKTLKPEEIEVYKKRIAEILEILTINEPDQQRARITEWLVSCVENECTRWEGSFELSPSSHFMSHYSRDGKNIGDVTLSKEQKARLKQALLATKDPIQIDFGLVDLVYKGNEQDIDPLLIQGLRALQEDDYWQAEDFMERLKHKNASKRTEQIIARYLEVRFDFEKKKEMKKYIDQFLELID